MRAEVRPDLQKRVAGVLDPALADEFARRVGHKSRQAEEQHDPPGELQGQGYPPLRLAVRGEAAGEANPVRAHRPRGETDSRQTPDQPARFRGADLRQVDGDRGTQCTV